MNIVEFRKNEPDFGLKTLASWIKPNSIVGEIGSYVGESAQIFLDSGNIKTLFCIDPWKEGYDDLDSISQMNMQEVENMFDNRMKPYNNYVKMKLYSSEAVNMFPDNFFDVIYIDGCHRYDCVINDLTIWSPKVKSGGWIAGHDYYQSPEVTEAVLNFFKKQPWSLFNDTSYIQIKE